MDQKTFEAFQALIYRESGIVLAQNKISLLSNRIQKRLRTLGVGDEAEYLKVVETDFSGAELTELLDAISTNVTYFYREEKHFEILDRIFTDWKKEGKSSVTVWCAAASSGEEPYTITFEALKHLDMKRCAYRFLGTDICTEVLHRAVHGVYRAKDIEAVPNDRKQAYFQPVVINDAPHWQVKKEVRDLLTFKRLNLVQFPYPLKGPFDVIFCRNVMIYFDVVTREKIVKEFFRLMRSGGYLFISHSESLLGFEHGLEKVDNSVYKKP
jgi:chemotaxis protein methyltransferase CheR